MGAPHQSSAFMCIVVDPTAAQYHAKVPLPVQSFSKKRILYFSWKVRQLSNDLVKPKDIHILYNYPYVRCNPFMKSGYDAVV